MEAGKRFWSWFAVVALAALARNVKTTARLITAVELSQWATDSRIDFSHGIAEMALKTLCGKGYLHAEKPRLHHKNGAVNRWRMTAQGLAAAKAAYEATTPGAAPDATALPTRVWNLLRIRRHLTELEAAKTLIDTGDAFEAQTKRIGALLAAWAKHAPEMVCTGKKREAGRIRYTLECVPGRWPPPSRPGEIHPEEFAHVQEVPQRFLKATKGMAQEGGAP